MKKLLLLLAFTLVTPSVFANPSDNLVPLVLWWSGERLDNFTASTRIGHESAVDAGYGRARVEGCISQTPLPNTRPMYLYWLGIVGDNASVAGSDFIARVRNEGYRRARLQGYIFNSYQEGLVPLILFYKGQERDDYFSTATEIGRRSAISAGYTRIGVIGYVLPASSC